jgi:hypothetical protein
MISVDFVESNPPSIGRYRIDPFPYVVASASLSREENLFSSLAFALDCGRIETKYLAPKEGTKGPLTSSRGFVSPLDLAGTAYGFFLCLEISFC